MGLKPHAERPQRPFLSYMYIYQSACVHTVSVESGHRVAALGCVGHIFRKTCTKLSTSCLELLYEQKLKLEHQFYHFQPKMGLKPHAVRPQRPFWSYMYQSACVDTVSVESRHRLAALSRVGHISRKTCTELSLSYLELQYEQKLKLEHQFQHFFTQNGP